MPSVGQYSAFKSSINLKFCNDKLFEIKGFVF